MYWITKIFMLSISVNIKQHLQIWIQCPLFISAIASYFPESDILMLEDLPTIQFMSCTKPHYPPPTYIETLGSMFFCKCGSLYLVHFSWYCTSRLRLLIFWYMTPVTQSWGSAHNFGNNTQQKQQKYIFCHMFSLCFEHRMVNLL
jgi:hypothetical protein